MKEKETVWLRSFSFQRVHIFMYVFLKTNSLFYAMQEHSVWTCWHAKELGHKHKHARIYDMSVLMIFVFEPNS
jgi:hypothetical protein